jgi:predicted negative regulator of RcsB-dependent stress response
LNIKYNKQKQEMRDDPVMDFLFQVKDFFKVNGNKLTIGVIIVFALIAGSAMFNYSQKANINKASADFGNAMIAYNGQKTDNAIENFKAVAEKYKNTPQAYQSAYLLGNIYYEQGKYDDAKKAFEMASKENATFIGGAATEALAACYEALNDNVSAKKTLEKALSNQNIAYRFSAIKWKLALLNKGSDAASAKKLCQEIISDTSARDYHADAENLLAAM